MKTRVLVTIWLQVAAVIPLMVWPTASSRAGPDHGPALRINPLLVAQAAEVWAEIGRTDNPVWPGWNASDTPLLFYLPGLQDVLINHPRPPTGFRRYGGPVSFPRGEIYVRDGRTFFEYDGQNTVLEVAGAWTLVVADTLSNLRSQVRGWLADPRPNSAKIAELGWEQLQGNPYDTLGMIAHEAFHAFQNRQVPRKGGSEEALIRYPTIAAPNTLGFALEGDLLAEALRLEKKAEARPAAVRWLAVRRERRKGLTAEAANYEDRMEYLEGLAKYVEYRLLEVLEGGTPGPAMAWVQGFQGYADLRPQREALVRQLRKMMRGEVNVNNDPYGASPLRMRLYYSGMGIAVLLDRLSPNWKQQIFREGATLTDLAIQALRPSDQELAAALAAVRAQPNYAELTTQKAQLKRDGEAATSQLLGQIEAGPKSSLVVDYSKLGEVKPAMSFTPFGILRVDDHRTIYRLIPITVKVGGTTFRQMTPAPLLHDRRGKRFVCQLQESVASARLKELLGGSDAGDRPRKLSRLQIPGVIIDGGFAVIHAHQGRIQITLEEK